MHGASVQTLITKPSSIPRHINDMVVIMDAMSVGMIKSKYTHGSNAKLTKSLVWEANVSNTLQNGLQNSLVRAIDVSATPLVGEKVNGLTKSLVRATDVPTTPSGKMYIQMDVNPVQMSNASSAMQRWTPKPVKPKLIKHESMDLWSDRLGGASESSLNALAKDANSAIKLSTSKLSEMRVMQQAKANMKAKSHSGQMPRVMVPGHKWYGDSSGPHVKSFIFHYQYEFGFVDDATNLLKVFFAKRKSEADEIFLKFTAWNPHITKVVIVDGAKEYFSGRIKQHAWNRGVSMFATPAYVHQRNARIEHCWYRTNRMARYMIARCGGWRIFWAFAKAYSVEILNVKMYSPTGKVPYVHFHQRAVDCAKFLVFGCTIVVGLMVEERGTV